MFSFNSCSDDEKEEGYDKNYKEILKKYEKSTFKGYQSLWTVEEERDATLEIREIYELNGEYLLNCKHSNYKEGSFIGYNKEKKSFYIVVTTPRGDNFTMQLKFVNDNTLTIETDTYTRK